MKRIRKVQMLVLLCSFTVNSFAWGVLGHRIVGQVADSYLTRQTKKEIFKILGNESVAMCSNWADFIKSEPSYNYLNNWHYINFKGGLDSMTIKRMLDTDTGTNAFTKINFLVAQLRNKDIPQENKALYLRLLIHIVGDIHQPLHVGRPDDLGGNRIRVLWFRDSVNLHQVWDERLINFQQLSYTEYAAAINFTTKELRRVWQAETLSDWIWQSYKLAEGIYGYIKQPNQKLEYRYNYDYYDILNLQLLKGGVHLAGLLNEIFG